MFLHFFPLPFSVNSAPSALAAVKNKISLPVRRERPGSPAPGVASRGFQKLLPSWAEVASLGPSRHAATSIAFLPAAWPPEKPRELDCWRRAQLWLPGLLAALPSFLPSWVWTRLAGHRQKMALPMERELRTMQQQQESQ